MGDDALGVGLDVDVLTNQRDPATSCAASRASSTAAAHTASGTNRDGSVFQLVAPRMSSDVSVTVHDSRMHRASSLCVVD